MLVFLQRNLVWMIFSLALSGTLWLVVTTQQNPNVVDAFPSIPVELRNVPDGMIVRTEPPPVRVTFVAPADVMPSLRATRFRAQVDLSRGAAGLQEVPIEVTSLDGRVTVEEVTPARASVLLEPVLRRTNVPVRARLSGTAPPGYLPRTPRLNPDTIAISGPKSAVEQVVAAVAEVSLTGVTANVSQVYSMVPQNAAGERVDRVTMTPENVLVELAVEQERAFKAVPVSVELRGAPAAGYHVVGLRVDPASMTLEGDPRAIEALQFVPTQPVDLNNTAGDLSVNTELDVPTGVRVARAQPIVVRVFVAPVEGSKVIEVAPTVEGVAAGLRSAITPGTVRLTLTGPMPVLTSLTPREIRMVADASGLTPGTHTLRPRIEVPSLVRLQAIAPEQVQVTLAPQPTPVPSPTPAPPQTPSPAP